MKTHKFNATIVHCSNNYGHGQNKEKLIPKAVHNILNGINIPLYGDPSKYYRNWIHTLDFCDGIMEICVAKSRGVELPRIINFGSDIVISNSELIRILCEEYISLVKNKKIILDHWGCVESTDDKVLYQEIVTLVTDRPAHDRVYNVCYKSAKEFLGWVPKRSLRKTLKQLLMLGEQGA